MFKKLRLSLPFLILSFVAPSHSSSVFWNGDVKRSVNNYLEIFNDFRYRVCKPKSENKFDLLLKKYRGEGFWIPELKDDVDIEAIKFVIPDVQEKLDWIRGQKAKVTNLKKISLKSLNKISKKYKLLMDLKKSELEEDENVKLKARQKSLVLITELQNDFDVLLKDYSYFSNFKFPVDHLRNRKIYDMVRVLKDDESKKYANKIFLQRKIFEDGTYLKDHTNSDIYLRTTLDTLYFELKQHDFYLTESARYDLDFVIEKINSELERGKNRILERLSEWETRTEKFLKFYENLIAINASEIVVNGKKTTKTKELIHQRNEATNKLKNYVYQKQADVYKFWLSKSDIDRAVFVIETILMNEVGPVDGEDALERMDVARVVLNRFHLPRYGQINTDEFVYPFIRSITQEEKIQNEKWLNLLFKQGEFSFTYYYMNGAAKIFCPDISNRAKNLRKQNVEIAFLALKEGKTDFQTTRYFSRASMIGRIHMDSIWEDYSPFPERPGLLVKGQNKLREDFKNGEFIYLYTFTDPLNKKFQVIRIREKNYAVLNLNGVQVFYQYRNPHLFRYFTKLDT